MTSSEQLTAEIEAILEDCTGETEDNNNVWSDYFYADKATKELQSLVEREKRAAVEEACRASLQLADVGEYGEEYGAEWAMDSITARVLSEMFPDKP